MAYNPFVNGNWWLNAQGQNTLTGVPGDDTNPPKISDYLILEFVQKYPQAKAHLELMLPFLKPEEQERLNNLKAANPMYFQVVPKEATQEADDLQRKWMTQVSGRVSGPHGGGN
jgi:hypothetical protein